MLRVIPALLLLAAVFPPLLPAAEGAARPPRLADLFGDDVIARGRGVEVKRSQLEEAFTAFKANLAAQGRQVPESQRTVREAELLQRLIVTQILTNRATDADRNVAKELAEKFAADSKRNAASEEAFNRQLRAMGLTPEQFARRLNEQAFVEAVIQRELTSTIKVTDEQVKDFYTAGTDLIVRLLQADLEKAAKDPAAPPTLAGQIKQRIEEVRKSNLARLEQPERVRVSHVFFATQDRNTEEPLPEEQRRFKRQQVEKIRQRALAGEDFARLVQEFSEDRGLKQTKGEYTFSREDPFAPEFKAAAFSLEPGKISDVVSTAIGFHIIKLLERFPAKKVELDKIASDLKEMLTQQEVTRAMPEYFSRLIKEAGVEILDARYKIEGSAEPPKKNVFHRDPSPVKQAFVEIRPRTPATSR